MSVRTIPSAVALLVVASPALANPLVDSAAEASARGDHAQAVADLRRAAASVAEKASDPKIRDPLDRAHARWLDGIASRMLPAASSPTAQLAIVGALLDEARRAGSGEAARMLDARRDELVQRLVVIGMRLSREEALAEARRIEATAGGERAAERVRALVAEVRAAIARLAGDDEDTRYLRGRLASYYRIEEPPAHPRPIRARWRFEQVTAGACGDVVDTTRASLSTDGADEIVATLAVSACTPGERVTTERRSMTYFTEEQVPITERSFRTVKETIRVPQVQKTCTPIYESGSVVQDQWGNKRTSYYSIRSSCYTDMVYVDKEVTRDVYDETTTMQTRSVPHTEAVDVRVRTSTLELTAAITAKVGSERFEFKLPLRATTTDEAYDSAHSGTATFGEARGVLAADLANQLVEQLADLGRIAVRGGRIAALDRELAAATGADRVRALVVLAVEEGFGRPELVRHIAATTTLPEPHVESALRGARVDAPLAFTGPSVDLALPEPTAGALADLVDEEERYLLQDAPSSSGGVVFGLGTLSAPRDLGYGVSVGLRWNRAPKFLMLRVPKVRAFAEFGTDIFGGAGVNTVVFGSALGGVAAGFKIKGVTILAEGVAGVDGGKAFADPEVMTAPGDPGVPGAAFVGYGASLRISTRSKRSLSLAVRRTHRTTDEVPELWSAEARYAKRWFFLGARAAAYRPLLEPDASGPVMIGLTLGVLYEMLDLEVGDFATGARTR